ncbi:uncharacterized protein LOC119431848 [Dermacentor silvarum]|uniref:uncharacterized protein LOC119431848 n=1 Tax=Dermacentor silvarum TaxID=543639 RepID=UPI0021011021|nr:uncharacterized protein LOC119431848 [Dermacentor silvarum]
MAFAGIAPPDPFLPTPGRSVQPWSRWHDMFKVCLVASGASEFSPERRRALLLHSLGPEGQRIFNTLSVSQAAEKTEEEKGSAATPDMYESAVAALAKHFDTTCNLVVEHHQFHCRIQSPGESIQEYMTALTELAVKCLFTSQEESLRDQFVAGVSWHRIRERLMTGIQNLDLLTSTNMTQAWGKLKITRMYEASKLQELCHPLSRVLWRYIPEADCTDNEKGSLDVTVSMEERILRSHIMKHQMEPYMKILLHDVAFHDVTAMRIYRFSKNDLAKEELQFYESHVPHTEKEEEEE